MGYIYLLICEACPDDPDIHISYGIAAAECYDGRTVIIQSFGGLSHDLSAVRRLVNLCNELELDIVHLPDVIDDFLAGI